MSEVRQVAEQGRLPASARHHRERFQRQAEATADRIEGLVQTASVPLEARQRTTGTSLDRQVAERLSGLELRHGRDADRLRLHASEALSRAHRIATHFETLGAATAHLTSVDGGPPDLTPGATIVLETIDRLVWTTVQDVQMRPASNTPQRNTDQER